MQHGEARDLRVLNLEVGLGERGVGDQQRDGSYCHEQQASGGLLLEKAAEEEVRTLRGIAHRKIGRK